MIGCRFNIVCAIFFFFKQKTAYEMRISDWSSDVCSSDLLGMTIDHAGQRLAAHAERHLKAPAEMARLFSEHSQAIAETKRFAACIGFTLELLAYEDPHEQVTEGWHPKDWREHLEWQIGRAQG